MLALAIAAGALVVFFPGYGIFAQIIGGLATGEPGINTYPDTAAGQSYLLGAPYPGAPNLIPHSVRTFKITRDRNDCIACHQSGFEVKPGHVATKIPASHYDGNETGVAGRRYNCLQCHMIQASEEPAVPASLALTISKTNVYWGSYADYTSRNLSVAYSIANGGTSKAFGAQIAGTVNNAGVTSNNTPLPAGDIAIDGSAAVIVIYHVPAGVARFITTVYLTASDASSNPYEYPGPYPGA